MNKECFFKLFPRLIECAYSRQLKKKKMFDGLGLGGKIRINYHFAIQQLPQSI